MTRRVIIALGSNMGDRLRHLRHALDRLPGVAAHSLVYETSPVGAPDEQEPYLNAVVVLETSDSARTLLELGQTLEREAGRVPAVRWSARPLDVDILWIDGEVIAEADLIVPHPRAGERAFVLVPLSDVAADVVSQLAPSGIPPGQVTLYPGQLS